MIINMSGGGIDTSDANATASKIFKNYTAYVNGNKITGTALSTTTNITADKLFQGYTAYDNLGNLITGTYYVSVATLELTSASGDILSATMTNGTTTITGEIFDNNQKVRFNFPYFGTWTPTINGSWCYPKTFNINQSGVITWWVTFNFIEFGGILCGDCGDNGNYYTFIDNNYEYLEPEEMTIQELSSQAKYVSITGSSTTPRYLIYSNDGKISSKIWGKKGSTIGISSTAIGAGKTNTDKALTYTGWESNSIFTWIKSIREYNSGGYNDWFIASQEEAQKIQNAGIISFKACWVSSETDADNAPVLTSETNIWNWNIPKNNSESVYAIRSI